MAEIQKYNLREKLEEADRKYKGDPALVGSSAMTFAPYNNSTRTNMFTSQTNQFLNITEPEFPFVFTGVENTVGRNSSGYKQIDSDIKIFKKVVKFENLVDRPYVYQLFYWDEAKKRYDVYMRKEVENLGQDYGYAYNNATIDELNEGDEVPKETILYRSRSYDKSMNYRYGMNVPVAYTFDPFEYEDASTISESFHAACVSIGSVKKKTGINDNDIPLNIFGDDDEYRPLPWIGETVDGMLSAVRPYIGAQELHDCKHVNLQCVTDADRKIFATGTVVDYEIYLNNPDWIQDDCTAQIWMLIDSQNRYWKKIQETCQEIIATGKEYSHGIDLLYDQSMKFLERNPNQKWNNGSSTFGCVEIRAHIVDFTPLSDGGKFTARYGNKSVVTRVLPDHMMPFTADGEHVAVLLAQPAVPNRTTGFVPHELHLTWMMRCTRKAIKEAKTLKDKEFILWDFIKRFNIHQYEQMWPKYKALSTKEKEAYMQSVVDDGIFSHQDMINEDGNIFFKLMQAEEELPYLKTDTLYTYCFGHVFRLYQKFYLGSLYMFPLKQTDARGFSVRATGAINLKGLPERSYKNKKGEAPFSDTAIRFGEYEALTMLIGLSPEEFTAMECVYRTSPEASEALTRAQFDETCEGVFKEIYTSRPAEIINIYFRHLGIEPRFYRDDHQIGCVNTKGMRMYQVGGKTYLCNEIQYMELKLRDRIRQNILLQNPIICEDDLERLIQEEYAETGALYKEYDGHEGYHEPEEKPIIVDVKPGMNEIQETKIV